jgi:hypothetical protein
MTWQRYRRDLCLLSAYMAVFALIGGCDGTGGDEPNAPPELRNAGGPGAPGKGASSPEIRAIMVKLNKGPTALGTLIGAALKAEKPAWETIQPQTKEFAQLAGDMSKHEPAKGSKESWSKLSGEYAELATELDKAAQAKDKAAASAAQDDLASSCMACHRQHRGGPGMGGGMGRPGGGPPGGPGGPPRGGPPGGPGGPPGGGPPPGGPPDQQK